MEQTEEQKRNAYMAAGIPLPTITADSLTQKQAPINLPPQPMPTDALNTVKGAIATATYTTPNGTKVDAQGNVITETPKPTPTTSATSTGDYSWIKEMLGLRPQPTSLVDERTRLQEQEGVLAKQKEVDELRARLAPLQAEAQQIELQRASIPERLQIASEGRGITKGGLAPIEAGELRKNYLQSLDVAVRTLPLTAQLNASQGRLDSAKENVNQLLELTYKDQTAKLDWFDTMYDRLEGRLNKEQEERMQLRKEETDRLRQEADTLNEWKQFYAKSAMDNNDIKTASAIGLCKDMACVERNAGSIVLDTTKDTEFSIQEIGGRKVRYGFDKAGNIVSQVDLGSADKISNIPESTSQDPFIQKLLNTAGGKPLTDTPLQQINKGLTVLGQLGALQNNIKNIKTGPILGAFKGANPWDTNAQTIKAQLNAVVPNLARGIYGEVGVLTDNDIKTYSGTIGNLKSTNDVNNAIMYITLDLIGKSIKNTLEVQAAGGRDVSKFVDIYTNMEDTKNSILQSLPNQGTKSLKDLGVTKDEENLFDSVVSTSTNATSQVNSLRENGGFLGDLFNWLRGK